MFICYTELRDGKSGVANVTGKYELTEDGVNNDIVGEPQSVCWIRERLLGDV